MIFTITSESLVVIGLIFGGGHIPMTTFFGFEPHLIVRITVGIILAANFLSPDRNNPIIVILPRHPGLIGRLPRHGFPNFEIIPLGLPINLQFLVTIVSPMNSLSLRM